MFYGMTDVIYRMDKVDDRLRFIISFNDQEVGSLYFEKAKKGFNNKPLSMEAWECVDAKIERLYEVVDYEITLKDNVEVCMNMIKNGGA